MLERGSENVQQLLTEAEGSEGVWVWGVCGGVGVGSVGAGVCGERGWEFKEYSGVHVYSFVPRFCHLHLFV